MTNVVVAGVPRSGTTWVGDVLSSAPDAVQVFEPDNPQRADGTFPQVAKRGLGWMPVLAPGEPAPGYKRLWDLALAGGWPTRTPFPAARRVVERLPAPLKAPAFGLMARAGVAARRTPEHVVVKTVHGSFALEWITASRALEVVVVRRNLFAVYTSNLDLGWGPAGITTIPGLDDLVRREGWPAFDPGASLLAAKAWEIAVMTKALEAACARNPEWPVVWHEDLVASPVERFGALFERLGLPWNDDTRAFLERNMPGAGKSTTTDASAIVGRWASKYSQSEIEEMLAVFREFNLDPRAAELPASRARR